MNFDSLFAPRIRPSLLRRLNWLSERMTSEVVQFAPGELIREFGHPMSEHGIALRSLLSEVARVNNVALYEVNKVALKELLTEMKRRDALQRPRHLLATRLRSCVIDRTFELDAAQAKLNRLRGAGGEEYLKALSEEALLRESLHELGAATRLNSTEGPEAATRHLSFQAPQVLLQLSSREVQE